MFRPVYVIFRFILQRNDVLVLCTYCNYVKAVGDVVCVFVGLCFVFSSLHNRMGHAAVQLVDALRYKPEGRGIDSRWCHWNILVT
jgi:hypothetical protein